MSKPVNPNVASQNTLPATDPGTAEARAANPLTAWVTSMPAGSVEGGTVDATSEDAEGDGDSTLAGGFSSNGSEGVVGQGAATSGGYSSGTNTSTDTGLAMDPGVTQDSSNTGYVFPNPAQQATAHKISKSISDGDTDQANADFTKMLGTMDDLSGMSIEALIQYVLREAYRGTTEDVRMAANKVKFQNAIKKSIRDEYSRTLTGQATADASGKLSTAFTATPLPQNHFVGNAEVVPPGANAIATVSVDANSGAVSSSWNAGAPGSQPSTTDANALGAYSEKLKNDLQSVDDDTQLANQELQTLIQRMTELMQTLTQISKDFHDTKMKIIGNI